MERKPEQFSAGRWWRYPILRNALLSGGIAALGFALAHLAIISAAAERSFYLIAIPLGGYHWAREALEELVREHEVGIDLADARGCGRFVRARPLGRGGIPSVFLRVG